MSATTPIAVPVGEDAPILEVVATMRAMRRLKPDPVPDELLERLVEAATWAPSGSNTQAYGFIVVTDLRQIERLAVPWRACAGAYLQTAVAPAGMAAEKYARMKAALRYLPTTSRTSPRCLSPATTPATRDARSSASPARF